MALQTINGRDGTADWTVGGVSYAAILNEFECESNVELIDSSVFSIEGVATQDPGMERIFFRVNGLLKKGTAASGPLIPAPQNVALVFIYSTGCTIGFTSNFSRSMARRTVNRNSVMAAEGVSNGAFVVTWVKS